MKRISVSALILLSLAVLVTGCAPPFSKELLDKVDRNIPFSALQKDPERFVGKLVMVGGTIIDTRNLKEGSQIEVLQRPLDGEGEPENTDATGGRFLVVTKTFIDAAVFHRGRSITIIGEIAGSKRQPLGEVEYLYPVLTAKDMHLWAPYSGPRFSIGVGVFRGF